MKTIDRLIEMLCAERDETVPDLEESEKERYFRALCNVRLPAPVTEEFLRLQDRYLSEKTRKRGIVCVQSLQYRDGIALWQGDITRLDADAIVNACNPSLLGCFQPLHDCIDNAIHSCAGVQVRLDCHALTGGKSQPAGGVKVTDAYNLPSKYIFHTVGPIVNGEPTQKDCDELRSCYRSCLEKARDMRLETIAFCCISTGVYRFPSRAACRIAVETVREWRRSRGGDLEIVFNVFTDKDRNEYELALGLRAR